MLVGDALDGGGQLAEIVDIRRVGEDGAREGSWLRAADLVRLVEDVAQLRVRLEHVLVEQARDGHAVLLEHGYRRFDDGYLRGG